MRHPTKAVTVLLAALLLTASVAWGQAKAGQAVGLISITNLTGDQIFAPAIVASHNGMATPLFIPGQPASMELAMLAEENYTDQLVGMLMADPNVLDVNKASVGGGVIKPGQTAHAEIVFDLEHNMVSLAAMLVTTNDAFVGVRSLEIPLYGSDTYMANAWDAGSERNTEMCAHIPGPPCGIHDGRVTDGAEGFVHISPGIQGGAEVPMSKDWRNPVAYVMIRGLNGGMMKGDY